MAKLAPDNALLRSLSKADLDKLEPHLQLFDLKTGATLYEMEDPVEWVYLPEVGLLSLIIMMESGAAIETSIVGREGGVGFIEALGSGKIFSRVIVQVPGKAYRVHAKPYREAFDASASMRKAVHQQIELLQAEGRQAIACHSLHEVKPRFNRWLLECQDLAGGMKVMPLKQEFLAVMLGVTRTTVTRIYDSAFYGLVRHNEPSVFRDFLLASPRMFMKLGEAVGGLSHITSYWRYRFPDGAPLNASGLEALEIINEFEASLPAVRAEHSAGGWPQDDRETA